jgi:hypothetical protein
MSTPRRAGEILNHYFRQLFEAQGMSWGRENQADIIDLVRGLVAPAARPVVPPAPPSSATRAAPRTYDTVNIKASAGDTPTWLEEV